jgi:hypothetical protein
MVVGASSQNLSVDSSRNNHISSLDGVRGFAVLLVVIFHLWVEFLPGGFLGVSLFFTLSGFVITSSLLRERDTTGHVRLRSFWARRARRLLPASLIVITAATIVWAVQGWMDSRIATEHIYALLQIHNWRMVIDDQHFSFFPNAVSHLWSLSLEMQFYVWAPLAIMISAKWKWFAVLVFTLTIATGLVVTFLYNGHMNRVYGSAFTRWAEIATGCLVALFFNTKTIDAKYRQCVRLYFGSGDYVPLVLARSLYDFLQKWWLRCNLISFSNDHCGVHSRNYCETLIFFIPVEIYRKDFVRRIPISCASVDVGLSNVNVIQ